ncbi:DUF5522 domain-containing protein [Cyclobacterium sp.]|uniref:DUF5522 domain-containing protein n=1 Tax=Cyclobacterium sp. TaxID=1966343 RepID=UPI0019CF2EF2|nr:DUF5522 domain-containing protein [Cyclobacterium sp.]MBD3627783.1 hypothetical protein [Cyclobacterium sp.]
MGSKNRIPPAHLLQEGIHYYYEGPFMVFTRDYHLLRGYCCNNACRHCPYREIKKEKE